MKLSKEGIKLNSVAYSYGEAVGGRGGWRASQVALVVKNLPANAGDARDLRWILGQEDPLEESMATHSSILAWGMPWTEEPGRLQSIQSIAQRVRHDRDDLAHTPIGSPRD